jgi:aminopeptidase N
MPAIASRGIAIAACVAALGAPVVASHAEPFSLPRSIPRAAAAANPVGIGDSYFPSAGNPGYDARGYSIDARYWPARGKLAGTATIRIEAKTRLEKFNLDLLLHAGRVSVDGVRAGVRKRRHELTVRPARPIPRGDTATVRVSYRGKPAKIRYHGVRPLVRTRTGAVAVGQPDIAAWWFPSNDHPQDKAMFSIRLTVPRGMEAIANGALTRHRSAGRTSTWQWSVGRPMATYLAFAAFGQYDIERGHAGGRPYLYAFERGLGAESRPARASLRATPRIVAWLERTWGRYPYRQMGGVVPNVDLGFALENQTRPVYGRDMFGFGAARSLVVHELAHQWFGDRVSLRRWKDIWLNEGFATYSEWLWDAHNGGRSPQQRLMRFYRLFEASNPFWKLRIGDPGAARLFDEAVYDRGAMTVQALRNRVGRDDFFRITRRWTHGRDGVGSTRELTTLAEHISGEKLDGFFRHWLYAGTKPARTAENGF